MRWLACLAICLGAAPGLWAQELLPAPQSVLVTPQPQPQQQPETIATPAPNAPAPVLSVIEPQLFAMPTLRWGFFKQRLVPGTVYVQGYRIRPARVSGPFYTVH